MLLRAAMPTSESSPSRFVPRSRKVRILATQLRALGVQPGDRVVSYMPNVTETAVAMIATVAIGAVWSSAAPEFGVKTVIERFSQIEPKVLFAADGYRFGGKDFGREEEVRRIADALPSLQKIVWLPYLRPDAPAPALPQLVHWNALLDHAEGAELRLRRARLDERHDARGQVRGLRLVEEAMDVLPERGTLASQARSPPAPGLGRPARRTSCSGPRPRSRRASRMPPRCSGCPARNRPSCRSWSSPPPTGHA